MWQIYEREKNLKYHINVSLQPLKHCLAFHTNNCCDGCSSESFSLLLSALSAVGPFTDRCVPYQIMSNQLIKFATGELQLREAPLLNCRCDGKRSA